jgi:hypothetical protein
MNTINIKIKVSDFIDLINLEKLKLQTKDLKTITDSIKIKPTIVNNSIKITDEDFINEFKKVIDNCSLHLELI